MNRREFLASLAVAPLALAARSSPMFPIGINTYSIRALRWNDEQLLDYAASLKLDAIFLQDSPDPRAMDPSHWPEVKAQAERLGLHLETGGGEPQGFVAQKKLSLHRRAYLSPIASLDCEYRNHQCTSLYLLGKHLQDRFLFADCTTSDLTDRRL